MKAEPEEGLITSNTGLHDQVLQTLVHNEPLFRAMADLVPAFLWIADRHGNITFINQQWRAYTGAAASTRSVEWVALAVHVDDRKRCADEWKRALVTEEPCEIESRNRRHDGTYRWFLSCVVPLKDKGRVLLWFGSSTDIHNQKLAEEKHRESETQYRQLLQGLPAAVYTCDANGYVQLYNKAVVELWGKEPVPGKDLWCGPLKIYRSDGTPLPLEQCPMAVALKECRNIVGEEIIIERPDGRRLHVAPNPQPIFDTNGKLTGALNMLIDITEQKRFSDTLRESEERFRSLADQAPIAIWMSDQNGDCTYLNTKWCETTGTRAEDGYKNGWASFIHPDDQEGALREWGEVRNQQKVYDIKFRYRNAQQEYILTHAYGNPRYNSAGHFVGYIGVLEDITLQENVKTTLEKEVLKRTEDLLKKNEELRRSEERYHRMTSEVQDYAIILLSKDGIIENWNKGAESIKGYKAEEIIGNSFKVFYPQKDRESGLPEKILSEARENGRAIYEGWRVKKDGSTFWGSVVITALHDESNNIIGFTKVTRDLTERKKVEVKLKTNALQLEEKNKELERINQELASFAYISSHDLQEPLRKIQTFISRILDLNDFQLSDRGKDYFDRIQSAAFRMQALINDLLTYSRTNTSDRVFEAVDVNTVLEDVKSELKEMIEEKGAVIESARLPRLNLIRFQFRQFLINILSNAIKFAKPGISPHIVIQSALVNGNEIPGRIADERQQYHHLSFADNGIGFDPAYSAKIFEVFQRLHSRHEYSGTGIGLAICKKIAENHGGFMMAEGEVNKGATFHLYLPE